ncbi:hypothetical protein HK103_002017 [Boothiomyces macroporosus]|uniref:Uncharacterized protein n=1 Tax=Boothiomyces macroporosus TaxID=261099 RepID=A0AAD5Y2S3_9FUNG|nr:hypothetical protein HK103_002017 [Boothiomyces macroporosus]
MSKRFLNVEYNGLKAEIDVTDAERLGQVQLTIKTTFGNTFEKVDAPYLQPFQPLDSEKRHINKWKQVNSLPQNYFEEGRYRMQTNFSDIHERIPHLSSIKWKFPKIEILSNSFQYMYRYLPKSNDLVLSVAEQVNYRKLEKAVKYRPANILEICTNRKMNCLSLSKILAENSRLTHLNLYCEVDKSVPKILADIIPHTPIQILEYACSFMTDDLMKDLFEALPKSSIKQLSLGGNYLTDISILSRVLKDTNITFLKLDDNRIDEAGIKNLSKGLIGSKVKHLDLENNPMDDICDILDVLPLIELESLCDDGDDVSQELLIRNLPKSNLKELRFGFVSEYIKDFLIASSQSKLDSVAIYSEDPDECCAEIQDSIQFVNFKKLLIDDITLDGLYHLAALIHTNLESLDLGNSNIEDEGMQCLAFFLPQTKIKYLFVNDCGFGDSGMAYVAACWNKTLLVHLEMRSALATNSGVQLALLGLQFCNGFLRYLDISLAQNVDLPLAKSMARKYPQIEIIF